MRSRKEIAEGILGYEIGEDGCARCPGEAFHTTASGERDWRIWFDGDGLPHEHCFHRSCQGARDEFMRVLYRAIGAEERGGRCTARVAGGGGGVRRCVLPGVPVGRRERAAELDEGLARGIAGRVSEVIDGDWLRGRSAVRVPGDRGQWGELLLRCLYPAGSRVLVFTRFRSQGDFMYVVGDGVYRLGRRPGVDPVRCGRLPAGGEEGVWFLTAPVSGDWVANPNKRDAGGHVLPGRRHVGCCVGFPYLVLESDVLDADVWLRILVQLWDPVVAVYTSGGKSVHALVRVGARTPEEFNVVRGDVIRRLSVVGADAAAVTPVRLSRLPGCLRYGSRGADGVYRGYDGGPRVQELLYLNPGARYGVPILSAGVNRRGGK